ncbi:MAG: NAD(P)-dependent dehydrogenase (short-subunit alcohol dehydrogenase family) [Colwellia sp.]|jgi:NAD(P)-dependent dehydrogenase (short-subunit alcohol dehydrogenase family)
MNNSTLYQCLKNKIVFITGGASGIGAAMVKAFADQQAKVAFIDIDNQAAQKLNEQLDGKCWYRILDVTNPDELQQAITDASLELGGLDVLVNNVANDMRHSPEDITVRDWHKCMQVNLDPAFFASQAVYNIMKQQGSGSIINFSSINAITGPERMSGYVTAKAGLIGMTKALAHDFGAHNIRVNAILPGWVATEKQLANWLTAEEEAKWMESMALKKRIEPRDVANLALFLASQDSSMISGQSIAIDGGKT